jgi:hypothetical protein
MPYQTIQINFSQIESFYSLYRSSICKPSAGKIPARLTGTSDISEKFFSGCFMLIFNIYEIAFGARCVFGIVITV